MYFVCSCLFPSHCWNEKNCEINFFFIDRIDKLIIIEKRKGVSGAYKPGILFCCFKDTLVLIFFSRKKYFDTFLILNVDCQNNLVSVVHHDKLFYKLCIPQSNQNWVLQKSGIIP